MKQETSYLKGIVELILAKNEFGIIEVKKIEYLKGLNYDREKYSEIVDLIRNGKIEEIKYIHENAPKTFEDITILKVFDQNNMDYIVIVYETDELWQNPVILNIVSLQ